MAQEDEVKDLALQEAPPQRGMGLVQIGDLMALASRPDTSPEKAREIYAFVKEVAQDQNRIEFTRDFFDAKVEMDGIKIKKNGMIVYEGKQGKPDSVVKFMRHDDISDVIKPVLRNHNMIAVFDYEYTTAPPKTICIMKIVHKNGHIEIFKSPPMPMVDEGGGKNQVQGAGSVGTYGRRYVVCPVFDIVAEGDDDDGNLARQTPQPITEEELERITNIVDECENREPGFRRRFTQWLLKEVKVQTVKQITQGRNLTAVMTKLREKMTALGMS